MTSYRKEQQINPCLCFVLSVFLLAACSGFAQERQAVQLIIGQQKIIDVNFPQRIAIGNEAIADVYLTSNRRQVLITGKGAGTTDLIIWGKQGNRESRRIIVWEKDPKAVADEMKELLKEIDGVKIKVVGPNIVLEGELFKQADLYRFSRVLKSYPGVINFVRTNPRLRQMVEVDVKIVEVGEEVMKDFNPIPLRASYEFKGYPSASLYSIATLVDFSQLNIWIKEGKAKLLAKPRLVVESGAEAKFFAGGEIPYQVSQGSLGGITMEWKKYGVDLRIKPKIDRHGNVELELRAEFSNPDWMNVVGGVPGIRTRWVQTKLLLQKGETAIIAGLLQRNVSKSVKRVPILGYIPVLNWFFSASQTQIKETELLIFVTPVVPAGISASEYKKIGTDKTGGETESRRK